MSFLISTQTLSRAWENAQDRARELKNSAVAQSAASNTGTMTARQIIDFERDLRNKRDQLDAIAALPGIAAYVNGLADTPLGYNVANEFGAMRTQIVATIQWIRDNLPKDVNGFLLIVSWGADGPVDRVFPAASLSGYRTQLATLVASLG